jgi:hypothetical protein
MATELDKVLNEEKEKDTPAAPEPEAQPTEPQKTNEEIKEEQRLANLKKAIVEAEGELTAIRKAKKSEKSATTPEEEDDLPNIEQTIEQDPTAKAFDRRQDRKIQPLKDEMEQAKSEVRGFALRQFLDANPSLARDSNKVKEMMQYYEKIRTCTERTAEGVLLDLRKAAAVVFHEDILNAARNQRDNEAQAEQAFSEPAVSSGTTGYRTPTDHSKKTLTAEERAMLAKWNVPEGEWQEDYKKYNPK